MYDTDSKKAQRVVRGLGEGAVASTLEQLLEDPDVQAVSVASYDDAHFQQVVAALGAGKHVFVEKPLCRTLDELRLIKEAWSKHRGQLKLSSNLVLRAAPLYQWLRAKIGKADLGDIYAFDGEYLYGRINKITDGWRRDVEDYSVMLGGGVHLMDLMVWLTGERPSSVHAVGNHICTKDTEFRYDDYVAATLRFPSGLIARIAANFGCVHPHQHVLRVFGTKGTFSYDDAGPRLQMSRDPSEPALPVTLSPLPETKGEMIAPFVSAILEDENMDARTQEMFDVMSLCVASDASLRLGSGVPVEYV